MKIIKNVVVRVIALLIFFAMIAAVILYQAGVYDISFIKRPAPITTENTFGTETADGTATEGFTDISDTTFIGSDTTITEEDAEKLLDLILSLEEAKKDGWSLSENIFGENSSIARLESNFGETGKDFSFREEKIQKSVIYRKNNGTYAVKTVTEKIPVPAVRLYYGLILLDNGKQISVRNSDGKVLIKDFKGSLVYAKSIYGRPVVNIKNKYYEIDYKKGLLGSIGEDEINFLALHYDYPSYSEKRGESAIYPYFEYVDVYTEITTEPNDTAPEDTERGTDTGIGTDEIDDTGVNTDGITEINTETSENINTEADTSETVESVSSDTEQQTEESETVADLIKVFSPESGSESSFETEAEEIVTDENGNVIIGDKIYSVEKVIMWGYRDAENNTVIEPQYKSANYFSEGLAAVVDFENRISFINESGEVKITLNDKEIIEYYKESRVKYRQSYYEPLNFDTESLGMYYFDRGYVMVRYVLHGVTSSKIYLNENRLLGTNGKYFDIPGGYSLVNYSDGIMLLEKNGKYGYMDLRGGWVVPPIYDSASPFIQGVAVVGNSEGKLGVINAEGEYLLPMYFDYISNASNGLISTYEKTRCWEIYCIVEK